MARIALLLLCFTLFPSGCNSTTSTGGGTLSGDQKKSDDKKSPSGNSKAGSSEKKANPLVGKWGVTKSNKEWAEHVAKQAVVEFLNNGKTMTITNNNGATAEAEYTWQGQGFYFQAKFERPGGTKNGYSAQVIVEKLSDNEIVADVFTLKRIK